MRVLARDSTQGSVPDTAADRMALLDRSDDEHTHRPSSHACVVLLMECRTYVRCDVQFSTCREGETHLAFPDGTRQKLAGHQALFQAHRVGAMILRYLDNTVLPTSWSNPVQWPFPGLDLP